MNTETLQKISLISLAVGEGIKLVSSLVDLFSKAPTLTVDQVEKEIDRIIAVRSAVGARNQAKLDAAVPKAAA